ncbi:MAG: cadherin-like beta sandwich domain-containing protein, partial [Christensenellales bacterium]
AVASVEGAGVHALEPGANSFKIRVTSQSGKTTTYTLNVNRQAASGDTRLTRLDAVNAATNYPYSVTPGLSDGRDSYSITVPIGLTRLDIRSTAAHQGTVVSGGGVREIPVGRSVHRIGVTAENGNQREIQITVYRGDDGSRLSSLAVGDGSGGAKYGITPVFAPTTYVYAAAVGSAIDSVRITATAASAVASVEGAGVHALEPGANSFKIRVTSQSGKTTTYTLIVACLGETVPVKKATANVHMRSGPGSGYSSLGVVNREQEVEVLIENVNQTGWAYVRYGDRVGFMDGNYLQ